MKRWWRWRQELRRLRIAEWCAYQRWKRAQYVYQDTAVVFKGERGVWGSGGPCDTAQQEVTLAFDEFRNARSERERWETMEPW